MRKLKPNEIKYVLYFMVVVFVISSFSFINLSSDNGKETVTAYLSIVGSQEYSQGFEVPAGANLYYLLYNSGIVAFQSDYSIRCVGQTCNDYVSANYWQVFLNNDLVGMDYLIAGGEVFRLYYGKRINLINVSLNLVIGGVLENTTLRVSDELSFLELVNNYNSSFANGSIECLFGYCGNWTALVNNESKAWDYSFKAGDYVFFELE